MKRTNLSALFIKLALVCPLILGAVCKSVPPVKISRASSATKSRSASEMSALALVNQAQRLFVKKQYSRAVIILDRSLGRAENL